jgi:hypothetical protein
MKENLLHFVWKLKLFSASQLKSSNGEIIEIISKFNELNIESKTAFDT